MTEKPSKDDIQLVIQAFDRFTEAVGSFGDSVKKLADALELEEQSNTKPWYDPGLS